MKTRSRDEGRTAGVGSVKRPSPGFGAMGETRRKLQLLIIQDLKITAFLKRRPSAFYGKGRRSPGLHFAVNEERISGRILSSRDYLRLRG
jgi:hypothetical protein